MSKNTKWALGVGIVAAIVGLLLGCATSASAQTPSAPGVELAKVATPSPVMVDDAAVCLTAAAKVFEKAKDAAKYCLDARRLEADRSKKVANEAADATKNNWPKPPVVSPYGNAGYYVSYDQQLYHRGTPGSATWYRPR